MFKVVAATVLVGVVAARDVVFFSITVVGSEDVVLGNISIRGGPMS